MGMVVRTNTMALNAYRQLGMNNSAVAKSLEKLASGYRINRAGDDAAGLAISEKMKAQITGLETASANAQDGISLIQTAEGNLNEVHDMLNRMVELASKSANGTYTTTERRALQDEVDQLLEEIDRISESANFNGTKLLDGSLSKGGGGKTIGGADRIIKEVMKSGEDAIANTGIKTILDGAAGTTSTKTVFDVDFTGLKTGVAANAGGAGSAAVAAVYDQSVTAVTTAGAKISIGGVEVAIADTTTNDTLTKQLAIWSADASTQTLRDAYTITADDAAGKITFTAKTAGKVGGTTTGVPAAAPGGATQITEGKDAVAAGAGADQTKFDFKLGGVTLATNVAVDGSKAAADIATAVFGKLTDADAATTGTQVKLGDATYTVTDGTNGKLTFTLVDEPNAKNVSGNFDWDIVEADDAKVAVQGNHTAGTVVKTPGVIASASEVANTVFRIEASDIKDGTTITVDGQTVTLAVGANSTQTGTIIDLKGFEEGEITDADMDVILSKISEGFKTPTGNFIVGTNNTGNADVQKGLTVHRKDTVTPAGTKYDTIEKLEAIFELKTPGNGNALTLQIGDTADSFNKMSVSVDDMSTAGLKLNNLSIMTESDASNAIASIKTAINTVSSARAGMGALQNRLEHTINNLDVAAENLSAANSRIRDTDMAKEMMNYTKMNVLVQSAQAMLAQANQQPQSVLQLLQ